MRRKIDIVKDRIEIKNIILRNLDLIVEKKNKKGIIINELMAQELSDGILAYLLGLIKINGKNLK